MLLKRCKKVLVRHLCHFGFVAGSVCAMLLLRCVNTAWCTRRPRTELPCIPCGTTRVGAYSFNLRFTLQGVQLIHLVRIFDQVPHAMVPHEPRPPPTAMPSSRTSPRTIERYAREAQQSAEHAACCCRRCSRSFAPGTFASHVKHCTFSGGDTDRTEPAVPCFVCGRPTSLRDLGRHSEQCSAARSSVLGKLPVRLRGPQVALGFGVSWFKL